MRAFNVVVFCVGVLTSWGNSQFLNNRPFPTYSLESMPDTDFSCRNKILGSYYADIETQCQMFHICVRVSGLGVQDFRFLCPNGTAFDQDHQICAEWEDVDCDYSTLYYASDNFDLYRIGSGFESKAVKYGEEEEVFALQRAETGDARISGDQQVYRVNQQKQLENANLRKSKVQNQYRNNNNENNNDEIFKGSSSSNFFNNRNRGKEYDEENVEDDKNVNYNQDRDYEQRRKVNRHQSRRPITTTTIAPTQRNNRPTGFLNNFAGSSFSSTAKPITTTEQLRTRQNVRKQYDYNNADNFRQNTRNYDDNNNNYPSTTYTISTPAPFRSNNQNNQPTTYSPKKIENYPSTQAKGFTKEPENYPSNFPKVQTTPRNTNYDANYEVTKVKNFETKKQTDYPTTFAPKTFSGQSFPSTFSPRTNNGYTQISQQTTQQQKQNTQQFNTQSTSQQRNTQYNTQNTQYNTQSTQYNTQNTQYNTQKPQANTQNTQSNTQSNTHNTQYNTQFNTQYSTTQQPNTQFNTKTNQYSTNTQTTQHNTQFNTQNTQYNTQTYKTQPINTRTTQLTTSKPTPFTQYTPTVPKLTSTTPVSRSNRFDETQYDDGSYNSKYDNYDNNDEFLKTAHSTNIANSRNELAKSKTTSKPQYDSPRPFSVTTSAPKVTETLKQVQKASPASTKDSKKEKNASYDYAYYDNNPVAETEYDIDTEFKKSTGKQ